jgi:hypothetical protein
MVATVTAELGWTYESSDRWVSSVNMGKILTPPPHLVTSYQREVKLLR